MKVLALDLSTKTGYCVMVGEVGSLPTIIHYGQIRVTVEDFNVKSKPPPNCSPKYPWNIRDAVKKIVNEIDILINEHKPDLIVIENTVKGANRHTQRILEWIHYSFLDRIQLLQMIDLIPNGIKYIDPSQWRNVLDIRLNNQDKKNNRLVSQGKKRGRIGKKHLSVRWVNENFQQNFKLKDNDIADAICLGAAFFLLK